MQNDPIMNPSDTEALAAAELRMKAAHELARLGEITFEEYLPYVHKCQAIRAKYMPHERSISEWCGDMIRKRDANEAETAQRATSELEATNDVNFCEWRACNSLPREIITIQCKQTGVFISTSYCQVHAVESRSIKEALMLPYAARPYHA